MSRFQLAHRLTDRHVGELTHLLARQWWSRDRDEDGVRRMLAGSTAVVALLEPGGGRLLAFGRALSDGVYRAHVYDVVVADGARATGLGRAVMDALLAHPALAGVERVQLDCLPELFPFYARWGFAPAADDCCGLSRLAP